MRPILLNLVDENHANYFRRIKDVNSKTNWCQFLRHPAQDHRRRCSR